MKEKRAFNHTAESRPWPASAATFVFNKHVLRLEANPETVFEGGSLAINNIRQNKPKRNH